jgi:hypothetical protein
LLLLVIGAAVVPFITGQPPRAVAAQPTPPPTPTPVVPSPSPLPPPIPSNGFAYITRGEVFYDSAIGATPVQLTSSGGLVDDYAWAPDGRSIVYKVKKDPNTDLGDLHQVDLASHAVSGWTVPGAASFAFSPDGASYVAAVPNHRPDGTWPFRLMIGSPGQAPDQAREVDVNTTVNDRQWVGYLTETPEFIRALPWFRGPKVYWAAAGIYFDPYNPPTGPGLDFLIDPVSKAVTPWTMSGNSDPIVVYRGPANPAFTLVEYGPLQITSNGQTTARTVSGQSLIFLSVSNDGSTALVTSFPTGGNGYNVEAVALDGSITPISTDGSAVLAVWQPPVTS